MENYMKRKQFHLSIAEERILYEMSNKLHVSEAEIVRLAIQEYGKKNIDKENSLTKMAKAAHLNQDLPEDLAENHDQYLAENVDHE